jgi:hypothetical protein
MFTGSRIFGCGTLADRAAAHRAHHRAAHAAAHRRAGRSAVATGCAGRSTVATGCAGRSAVATTTLGRTAVAATARRRAARRTAIATTARRTAVAAATGGRATGRAIAATTGRLTPTRRAVATGRTVATRRAVRRGGRVTTHVGIAHRGRGILRGRAEAATRSHINRHRASERVDPRIAAGHSVHAGIGEAASAWGRRRRRRARHLTHACRRNTDDGACEVGVHRRGSAHSRRPRGTGRSAHRARGDMGCWLMSIVPLNFGAAAPPEVEATLHARGRGLRVLGTETSSQSRYPNKMAACIPSCTSARSKRLGLRRDHGVRGRRLELSAAHVKGVVTFYSLFNQKPVGKHQVWVCRTLSCALAAPSRHPAPLREAARHPRRRDHEGRQGHAAHGRVPRVVRHGPP